MEAVTDSDSFDREEVEAMEVVGKAVEVTTPMGSRCPIKSHHKWTFSPFYPSSAHLTRPSEGGDGEAKAPLWPNHRWTV